MNEIMNDALEINGLDESGNRISSKQFEEKVQEAIGISNNLILKTYGQHNIGGRLHKAKGPVNIHLSGPVGQRLGCMGNPGTKIVCDGPASDDVGYLNIGADITVLGDATNGVCNAMAQGRVMIKGSIGSRGLTMTKWNPVFERPQLWVLGSTGDFFAEFNCGGIAVVCGVDAKSPQNVLGYRPCVGMVGGWIFYRGKTDDSYSRKDVRVSELDDEKWQWLNSNISEYLTSIDRMDLLETLTVRDEWKLLIPITPQEQTVRLKQPLTMAEFRDKVWTPAFAGPDAPRGGDPLRDLAPGLDRSPIGFIETGELRRKQPYWANLESASPCTYYCPVHIPTVERLRLLREGKADEAYQLIMKYTPLPASVCGSICPNLCMTNCSRHEVDEEIEVSLLGRALVDAPPPVTKPATGKKVAIIGGGPAGMSAAWHLAQDGVEAHIFEGSDKLGGKLGQMIPWERMPQAIWDLEIDRFMKMPHIKVDFKVSVTPDKMKELNDKFDYVIVAVGTHVPRRLQFQGHEKVIAGLDFLRSGKSDSPMKIGKQVVVIGAGNVGCDVACEAYRLGAEEVTLIDIQEPASFGAERDAAERLGATFKYPVITKEVTDEGVTGTNGEFIPAQTVIISIGGIPAVDFLPKSVELVNAAGAEWVKVDDAGRTTDETIYAIGDVKKEALATDALGSGKNAAESIIGQINGVDWKPFSQNVISLDRMTLEHYNPEKNTSKSQETEADRCLSCGSCRDCHLCEFICPQEAISRTDAEIGDFKYVVDDDKCIACGFCVDTCPCGIWVLRDM